MRYGTGTPLYGPEILDKVNALRNDPDFAYLTRQGIYIKCGFSRDSYYTWIKERPEFARTIATLLEEVEYASQEAATKRAMSGEKFSAAWMIYRTANVFGWRNTVDTTTSKQDAREAMDKEVEEQLAACITTEDK